MGGFCTEFQCYRKILSHHYLKNVGKELQSILWGWKSEHKYTLYSQDMSNGSRKDIDGKDIDSGKSLTPLFQAPVYQSTANSLVPEFTTSRILGLPKLSLPHVKPAIGAAVGRTDVGLSLLVTQPAELS